MTNGKPIGILLTGGVHDAVTMLQQTLAEGNVQGVVVAVVVLDKDGKKGIGHKFFGEVGYDDATWLGCVLQHQAMLAAGVGDDIVED